MRKIREIIFFSFLIQNDDVYKLGAQQSEVPERPFTGKVGSRS